MTHENPWLDTSISFRLLLLCGICQEKVLEYIDGFQVSEQQIQTPITGLPAAGERFCQKCEAFSANYHIIFNPADVPILLCDSCHKASLEPA